MSYILEALKKSEQERARGETPGVDTQHDLAPLQSPARERRGWLPWVLGGALLANALVLGLWLLRPATTPDEPAPVVRAPSAPAASAPTQPPATSGAATSAARTRARPTVRPSAPVAAAAPPAEASAPSPAESGTAPEPRPAPAAETTATEPPPAEVAQPTPSTPPEPSGLADAGAEGTPDAAPAPAPVAIRDLPARIQRSIPTLEFATHIFGDEPRYREVTINGRRYAEGERVEGMLLAEITETGVVFDYQGYRFEVSVLEDWDY